MSKSNHNRLVVYLNNLEKKNKFKTTYTYRAITSIPEAIAVVHAMHSEQTDTTADITRKIKKVVFNGTEIPVFSINNQHTKNGWVVK